jgi:hypothetical protein
MNGFTYRTPAAVTPRGRPGQLSGVVQHISPATDERAETPDDLVFLCAMRYELLARQKGSESISPKWSKLRDMSHTER